MIKIRVDADYAYPSRLKSFACLALNIKPKGNYVKNSKILAKMINESTQEVQTVWFFTPQTTPDAELLELLHPDRHEVGLHVATDPYREWERLEEATGRKLKHYTVHGTERLIARILWRRKLGQDKAPIPPDFPLQSYYVYPTMGLDRLCYSKSTEEAIKIAMESIEKGEVLHVHPEWLFVRGTINHRGPYYETLKTLLQVDTELENLSVRKKTFFKLGKFPEHFEYFKNVDPSERFCEKLAERGADVFTFVERKWCAHTVNASEKWLKYEDNIALLSIESYDEWWSKIGKKTRNMVRKAEKSGLTVKVVEPNEQLAEGISRIFNETPIRQGRAFSHYQMDLATIKHLVIDAKNSTFIGAYLENELVGFIQLMYGDDIAVMIQILSMQKHWDKAVNNAMMAKAVEVCASKNVRWLMYGRIGNHPSLDAFKESNGFVKYPLTRYYIPLTRKGKLATKLGLHREARDALPEGLKKVLYPTFSWISRAKIKLKPKRNS